MREGKTSNGSMEIPQTKIKENPCAPFTYLLHVIPYVSLVHSFDLACIRSDDPNRGNFMRVNDKAKSMVSQQ